MFGSIGLGGSAGGNFMSNIVYILVGFVILIFCAGGLWWFFKKRKQYNIKVEFKIPRNIKQVKYKDGSIRIIGTLNKEWGKGFYDAKKGVVYVKKKGKKPV